MPKPKQPAPASERSYEAFTDDDLRRLAEIALARLQAFYQCRPETGRLYQDRLLMLCLCQGAADHYVRPGRGVKDLDVWAFYDRHPERPFPYRARWTADFEDSRFGRHPDDEGFSGRRIDVLGRSLPRKSDQSPEDAVRDWLRGGSSSARHLAKRPVVVIWPFDDVGRIVWDPTTVDGGSSDCAGTGYSDGR